jgi:hypothetical protein
MTPRPKVSADEIRGLTLWQPWASLIALRAKKIETRGYSTSWRGVLAVHAARVTPPTGLELCARPGRLRSSLQEVGIDPDNIESLPSGVIVAVTTILDCEPTVRTKMDLSVSERELAFGNYDGPRYAWRLGTIEPVDPPIKYRGRQSLFFLDRDTIDEIRRRSRRLPEVF